MTLGHLRDLIDFGGHDEVALRQSVDLVGPKGDPHFSPGEQDVRMMPLFLGDGADTIHKVESFLKIGEREGARDVVLVDYIPIWQLVTEAMEFRTF